MTSRRDRLLEAMGLGPVWRLRARSGIGRDASRDSAAQGPPRQGESGLAAADGGHARAAVGLGGASPESLPTVPQRGDAEDRSARIARMDWTELRAAVAACEACPLARTRTQTVFGVGDERAELLIVGEAPGAEEDARGEPFVGQAGRLLDNMLAALSLKRGEGVYIANVLKCRPPQNRNPEPFEVAQCGVHLERQIDLIGPRLILAMGRFAAQTLLASDASIASMRGRRHRYRGIPAIVTYHPAYLLRNLPDKARAWEDLVFVRRTLRELGGAVRSKAE
jgi:DNA polymerase